MTSPRVRVLAIVPHPLGTAAGQRTTIEAWVPVLEEAGIDVEFSPFATERVQETVASPGRLPAKAALLGGAYVRQLGRATRGLGEYDLAFVYREAALVGPAVIERLIARRLPLVYCLDDPLHVPYSSPVNGALARLKAPGKVRTTCTMATRVIVNSKPLREYAETYNDDVVEIPSVVDGTVFVPQPRERAAPLCIGWTGSASTATNLELIAEPLAQVQRVTGVSVKVIGPTSFELDGVDATVVPWSAEREVEEIRAIDIGLLPIPDRPWNRWKFFLKAAQYMALGIPVVASDIGAVDQQVTHGVDGFIARTDAEWVTYLRRLVDDEPLRTAMGVAAAEKAHRSFTLQANREKIVGAFQLPGR
jgi:glycosyltransferase involved in cell wall biosynthesis